MPTRSASATRAPGSPLPDHRGGVAHPGRGGIAEDAPRSRPSIRNRLQQGMPLQIDATLCYAKGGCPPVPSNADKQIDSPYNTYRVNGLPPTPIMTVTEQSLHAALDPADVPYLFYVTGKDGVTYFATTLAEHEANIRGPRRRASDGRPADHRRRDAVPGVIGDPVAHSRSPAIHNAAYLEAGLDWVYVAFPVPRGGRVATRCGRRARLGIAGLNVTMPHKADAAWACDELTPDAAALGAVNMVPITRRRATAR